MKVLVDVCLSPKWVETLAAAGFEAVHWSALGDSRAPDSDIVAYANREKYIILTRDLDFGTILAARRLEQPSVVQLRVKQGSPIRIKDAVIEVLRQTADELQQGAFITLDLKRTRLRILPLIRAGDDPEV